MPLIESIKNLLDRQCSQPQTFVEMNESDSSPASQHRVAVNFEEGIHWAGDDEDFYLEILGSFLDLYDTQGLPSEVEESGGEARRYFHGLKSSAQLVGAASLSQLAQRIEQNFRDGTRPEKEILLEFEKELRQVVIILKDYLRAHDK